MKIIVDSREQAPFLFAGPRYAGTVVGTGTLATGDYSLAGMENVVAVERKSLDDLVGCLTSGRERFERELVRARGLDSFAVVVEASWDDLASGTFRSRMNPHAACQSVLAFQVRYRIPFLFCGSRPGAEYVCWSLLRQCLEGSRARLKALLRAHGEEGTA